MRVQPFPFGALPALARGDLWARHAVRSRLAACDSALLEGAFQTVLGTKLTLTGRGARVRHPGIGTPGDVGVLVAADGADLERAVLIEMEGALATAGVATALRGHAPIVYDTTQVPSARVVGSAAAVALAVLRRLAAEPVRVLAAGPAHALAADLQRRSGSLATWQGSILLQGTRYDVRLTTMPHVLDLATTWRWPTMDTPLEVPLVIARFVLPRSGLVDLLVGDALVLDLPVEEPRNAWLAAGASEHGVRVTVTKGSVVYGGEPESLPWEETEASMSESFQESLGDVPVVVRVEVGSVQLPAKRWAELVSGDTLTLGQRVGAPVTLRVSGVEVAHGELVQVEGELGVRITKRLDLPGEITHVGSSS